MNPFLRLLLFMVAGTFLMVLTAWTNGNSDVYDIETEEVVSPFDVEHKLTDGIDPDREYYYKTVIVTKVTPSDTPLMFESTTDTVSCELKSRLK